MKVIFVPESKKNKITPNEKLSTLNVILFDSSDSGAK